MVALLSYVEVQQGGRWDWRRRVGTRAAERPKAVNITRLAGPVAGPGQQAGGGWNGKEQDRGLPRLGPLTHSCWYRRKARGRQ